MGTRDSVIYLSPKAQLHLLNMINYPTDGTDEIDGELIGCFLGTEGENAK